MSWVTLNLEVAAGGMALWLVVIARPGRDPKLMMRLDGTNGYAAVVVDIGVYSPAVTHFAAGPYEGVAS